jgi:SSS family solute:Na+ symporter
MHTPRIALSGLAIFFLYLLGTILIGWLVRRRSGGANAYLNASRSLPLIVVTAAYLAANCGALELIGLSAMAAQYGAQAFQFYWIGAIPAMVFLSIWMMPVYRRSGIRSVPEYLEVRYGPSMRLLNAYVLALTTLMLAGVSLYAMSQVLAVFAGFSFFTGVLLSAGVVLIYVSLGGLRATIYNEVFQLIVIVAGLFPLAIRCFHLAPASMARESRTAHLWAGMPLASAAAPADVIGTVIGLGFILSFSFWCTDFVLMQRALAATTVTKARLVPLFGGFGKIVFSFLVVLPGLAAARIFPQLGHSQRFDQVLPAMMSLSYGPAMLGLGFTALVASLMSGVAANVSAFAALWTEDIYRAHLRKHQADSHYLMVGHMATVVAVAISVFASYANFAFSNLMEHVQLIFSVFGAPFWAIFLIGMSSRRTTERGAVIGFLSGTAVALAHLIATARGWIRYGSIMNANFHVAIYAFCTAFAVAWLVSAFNGREHVPLRSELVFDWRLGIHGKERILWLLSAFLLATCLTLNIIWK